jgi:hypothetical protein
LVMPNHELCHHTLLKWTEGRSVVQTWSCILLMSSWWVDNCDLTLNTFGKATVTLRWLRLKQLLVRACDTPCRGGSGRRERGREGEKGRERARKGALRRERERGGGGGNTDGACASYSITELNWFISKIIRRGVTHRMQIKHMCVHGLHLCWSTPALVYTCVGLHLFLL